LDDQQFIKEHARGVSESTAAKDLGCSKQTVSNRWNDLGLPPHFEFGGKRPHAQATNEQITEAHREELSESEIGKKVGLSQTSVSRRLRKLGLKPNFLPVDIRPWEEQSREREARRVPQA
jgi:transposase